MALALLLLAIASGLVAAAPCPKVNGNFTVPQLPYATSALLPAIDNATMFIHSQRHHAAYVNNLNAALSRYPALRDMPLSLLISKLGTKKFSVDFRMPAADVAAIRNNGGGHFNHALFWKVLRPNPASPADPSKAMSPELNALIAASFGSFDAMVTALRAAGSSLFGSGWAWLCLRRETGGTQPQAAKLLVVSTPNQDSPLMARRLTSTSAGCAPILGIDVWEHAYYLQYQNLRPSYLSAVIPSAVNWQQVEANYRAAKAGDHEALFCPGS